MCPECAAVAARRRKPRWGKRKHPSTMQILKAKNTAKRAIGLVRLVAALRCPALSRCSFFPCSSPAGKARESESRKLLAVSLIGPKLNRFEILEIA